MGPRASEGYKWPLKTKWGGGIAKQQVERDSRHG